MEAVQAESEDCLGFRPIDSSTQGVPDYSEALILGASALRVLQGLAPFGRPKTPVSIGESTLAMPDPGAATTAYSNGPDSCMFTTDHSAL